MEERAFIDKLRCYVDDKGNKNAKFSHSLYIELKTLKLPIDLTQRMEYLLKERDLLLQILIDYQLEYKVKFTLYLIEIKISVKEI